MARPRFITFAADSAGNIVPNTLVTLFEANGAAFSGNVYADSSGGSPLTPSQITTNSLGIATYYTDDTNAKYIRFLVGSTGSQRNGAFDPDAGQVVQRTTSETLTNKTMTAPILTSPAITGTGTFVNLNGTGTFAAKGLNSSSGKGGIYVGTNGTVYVGKSAYSQVNDAPQATFVVNRDQADGGSEGLISMDMFVRAAYNTAGNPASGQTDNTGITLTTSEGDLTGRPANFEGPAGNIIGIENRFITATYATKIVQGHHGTRAGMGIGVGTQTQATPAADGLDARDEFGFYVDCDGRSSFPALTWQGNPNPNYLNGVRTGVGFCVMGYTGSWFKMMAQKEGYGGHGDPRDPAWFIDYQGRHSIWGTPATLVGMQHIVRNTAALGANVPIQVIQGDNTGTVANQAQVRGQTATTKTLSWGYDTTNNWGTIQADNNGTSSPLLINPVGGSVYLHSSNAVGGGAGRFVVKQLSETGAGDGITVAKSGAGTQKAFSMTVDSNGLGTLTAQLPGTSSTTVNIGPTTADVTVKANAPASQAADLLQLQVNTSTKLSVSKDGLLNATVQSVAVFSKTGAISDADFVVAPPVGTIGIDTTGGAAKIYVRTAAATWKSVGIA